MLYLCFPTKNYYWDGIAFAMDIEDAGRLSPTLLHQNHLIYNVVGYLAYKLFRLTGAQVRAIEVLQVVNSMLSALCAFVLFHISRISFRSHYLSIVLTLLFAFSATWWKFSTDANSYISSTLLLLSSFYLLLPARKPSPIAVAILHTASMLLHQLAVFFYPVAVAGILLQTSGLNLNRRITAVLQYSAVAFLLTVATYYCCFYLLTGTLDPFTFSQWVSSYSSGTEGFSFDVMSNLAFTLRGHVRLFWGGRINLLRDFVSPPIVLLIVLLLVAFAYLCVQLVRHLGELKSFAASALQSTRKVGAVGTLALVWATPYLVFCFFFYPQDAFHRLVYFPSLILLLGVVLANYDPRSSHQRHWRAALFVIVLALSNFLFLIYPYSHVRKETPLFLALEMQHRWSRETVIFYAAFNSDNVTLRYFNPDTNWKPLGLAGVEEIEYGLLKVYNNGGNAWIETSAIDRIRQLPEGANWLATHAKESYELTDPAYKLKVVRIAP